jgi:CHAT domain-containing protein
VLIGDPLFDADLSGAYRSKADSVTQFGALPGTMAEIKAIENILHTNHWKTSVLLKGNATERNLKKIRSPDILHIATHGFFSAEFVSLNEEAKKDFLFHSGIVLSGANRQTERETTPFRDDGIVTAYEVMNLDLSQTELVVLSACETGLGKIENGEGVYGLQRSFLQAGARNVMISLWKVDDVYTKDLMIKFYAYFSRGFPKHESLKLAQLEQMKHVSDPKHWGGFILIGVD